MFYHVCSQGQYRYICFDLSQALDTLSFDKSLQAGTDSVQHWFCENYMELNIQKTKVLSFTNLLAVL
jgi:hypothetical protein